MTVRDQDSAGGARAARRKLGAFALTAFVAGVATGPSGSFLGASIASAHTDLESSTPADGDIVTDIVDEIELVFTEPVEPAIRGKSAGSQDPYSRVKLYSAPAPVSG